VFKSLRLVFALSVSILALPLLGSSLAAAGSSPPGCVVSLSPTATETLFAIGAGPQVQAVDTDSNFPTTGLPKKRINALDPECRSGARHLQGDLVVSNDQAGPRGYLL
jgi:ABC-type hemin transport system substrate-binding protein